MMAAFAMVMAVLGLIVLTVVLVLVRLLARRQDATPQEEEILTVQEMYRTLDRLEKRVDVLETLLADRTRSPRSEYSDL